MPWKLRKGLITKIRNWRVVLLLLIAWPLMGCERTTQVKIKGGTTPVFDLSGSGSVTCFTVFGPDYLTKAERPYDENFALWEIQSPGGYLGTPIAELGSITYGVVPPAQVRPQSGSPPPLAEGQKYVYQVQTTNAPGAGGYLEIRNSRAVPTTGSGPCFQRENGKWIRVRCWDAGS